MNSSDDNSSISRDVQKHYQWLDAMRGIAALIVVLTHARGFIFHEYGALHVDSQNLFVASFFALTRLGHEAVIVFFVLSGYLVGGRSFERMARGTFRERDYLVDRVARIWIPLVPALVISVLLSSEATPVWGWIGNLLGLQGVMVPVLGGNAPLWSLAYEIWFYVLAYGIGRQVTRDNLDVVAWCLILVVVLVFTKLKIQYLACWLIGAAAYLRPHQMSISLGATTSLGLAFVSVGGLQLTSQGFMGLDGFPPAIRAFFELLLAVSAALACVSLVALKPSRLGGALASLAGFSYTLYLVHFPLLSQFYRFGWVRAESVGLFEVFIYFGSVLGVALLAWCVYLAFERNTAFMKMLINKLTRVRLLPNAT